MGCPAGPPVRYRHTSARRPPAHSSAHKTAPLSAGKPPVPISTASRPASISPASSSSKPRRRHSERAKYTSPKSRTRSTRTPDRSTSAQSGALHPHRLLVAAQLQLPRRTLPFEQPFDLLPTMTFLLIQSGQL